MRKRWLIYIMVGILFGVFDFYYQEYAHILCRSSISWFFVQWSIWLIPIIPIVLYETKISHVRKNSILTGIMLWSISIFSYYIYFAVNRIFINRSKLNNLYISNHKDSAYFINLKAFLLREVPHEFIQWIGVAIVGGAVIGFLVNFVYLHFKKLAR